jgi:hypothetical protein
VAKYQFLSDEWFAIVEKLVEDHGAEAPSQVDMVMNVVVTDTPFGPERHLHIASRKDRGHVGIGHADDGDATVTTDYETAKGIFTSGDPYSVVQAFMNGKVRIQGDLAKVMAAQAGGMPTATNVALLTAIQGITE